MDADHSARVLSLLSHELRGPLGVIRGYLRLLEHTGAALSDQQRQAVAAALKATDRAADLLTQTSMLAHLDRGETPFDFNPVALKDLLAAAVEGVRSAEDPAVRLDVGNVPSALIAADESLLSGALTSLLCAVVRAQARETTLRVTAVPQAREGGDGIAVTIAADPLRETLTERAIDLTRSGLGLDLPIAQRLIAAHRGDLRELRNGERCAGVVVWLPTTS